MKLSKEYDRLQKNIRKVKKPPIEVWSNKYPDKKCIVTIEISEFTCLCPKTALPDFATIIIKYIPDKYCVELKSFKYYLLSYRNVGIFHEHAINRILDDFVHACHPRWTNIIGEFNPRGGIKTTVTREYKRK